MIARMYNGDNLLIPNQMRLFDNKINSIFDILFKNLYPKLNIKTEYDIEILKEFLRNEVKN